MNLSDVGGCSIIFCMARNLILCFANVVQELKEYDGKKLVSATKEGLNWMRLRRRKRRKRRQKLSLSLFAKS